MLAAMLEEKNSTFHVEKENEKDLQFFCSILYLKYDVSFVVSSY
jgi:hypothetical protein